MTESERKDFKKINGKLTVFGDRVAVMDLEEENDTGIVLPENRQRQYCIGLVVAVGDGRVRGEAKVRHMWLKPGDVVFMQFNGMMIAHCGCQVEGVKVLVIPQGDVIATLDSERVHADTFHVTGAWVLCRIEMPEKVGRIYLPDQSVFEAPGRPRYYVSQAGPAAEIDVKAGDEVKLDPGRANPFKLGANLMVYIDQGFIHAKVD
jgi:co-chaperonin GroES (HSP10)